MTKLILRELTAQDEKAFFDGLKEWGEKERSWFTFDYKEGQSFTEHLERLNKNKLGIDLAPQFVPSTMLYAFVGDSQNVQEQVIVGRFNIRHTLNDFLFLRGGHVGYAVAVKYRKLGYATEMLRQGILYCQQKLRLSEILITCSDTNVGSWKVIEACGGVLEKTIYDDHHKEDMRRYWIKK